MALIVLEGFGAWMAAFDGQVRAGRSISVGERGLKSFITAVLRLIAISSDRPILSVEKEFGITPLPLSAEFSPFLIPLMGELVGAGFATTTTERVRVSPRRTLEILRWAGHLMEASVNAATAVRYECQQDEAAA